MRIRYLYPRALVSPHDQIIKLIVITRPMIVHSVACVLLDCLEKKGTLEMDNTERLVTRHPVY